MYVTVSHKTVLDHSNCYQKGKCVINETLLGSVRPTLHLKLLISFFKSRADVLEERVQYFNILK